MILKKDEEEEEEAELSTVRGERERASWEGKTRPRGKIQL